jgi:hypothetical protein
MLIWRIVSRRSGWRAAGDRHPRLYDAGAALRSDQTRERYAALGVEPLSSTPEEYPRYIAAEIATWKKVVKQAGLAPAS